MTSVFLVLLALNLLIMKMSMKLKERETDYQNFIRSAQHHDAKEKETVILKQKNDNMTNLTIPENCRSEIESSKIKEGMVSEIGSGGGREIGFMRTGKNNGDLNDREIEKGDDTNWGKMSNQEKANNAKENEKRIMMQTEVGFISVYLSIYLSVCRSVCLAVLFSVFLSVCLSFSLSLHLSSSLSIFFLSTRFAYFQSDCVIFPCHYMFNNLS